MVKYRWLLLSSVAVVCMAAPAQVYGIEGESERDDYVAAAEPICKTNVLANKRIFKGAKGEVKAGELKKASTHFLRAATAFAKTIRQLEAIPRPAADEAKLQKWFSLLRDEKTLVEKIGRALAAGKKGKAEALGVDLNRNSNRANNAVLSFGFDYCRIEPSRFG